MAEWQWLMMPVKCLGKCCKNCPRMEIASEAEEIYGNDGFISSEVNLFCTHLNECLMIQKAVKDGITNA